MHVQKLHQTATTHATTADYDYSHFKLVWSAGGVAVAIMTMLSMINAILAMLW